ncbi:MAG: fibronectin type III-like domain-contianing protein, partial [Duncaniella sp.]|nr:fibronectin type III-like domain-contianing protein [Duncaniella sp.]
AFNHYYDADGDKRVTYGEGLLVGYRHYDTKNVKPNFAFGYGLSYTDFAFSDLKVRKTGSKKEPSYNVSFNVSNTGLIDGKEVAQVYVRPVNPKVFRPYKELKGYDKKMVKAGETVRFDISLDKDAFSYYKTEIHDFGFDPGEYEILVGNSSDNILLRKTIRIK